MTAHSAHPQGIEDQEQFTGFSGSNQFDTEDFRKSFGHLAEDAAAADSETTSGGRKSAEELLLKAEIKITDDIIKPENCITIEKDGLRIPIATAGNIMVVTGKAKSRKTTFVSVLVASLLSDILLLNKIRGTLPEGRNVILYFDTEQGAYHVQRVLKRICRLSGKEAPTNFRIFSLRSYETAKRLDVIRWAIYNIPNVGVVVLDGARDTVLSINDEEEATVRVTDFMKWTAEKQIHLITILHENKNDRNARGHLGTELTNKCETLLSVKRCDNNKEVSVVTPEYCRDRDPDEIYFSMDEHGTPFLMDAQEEGPLKKKASKLTPHTVETATHEGILRRVFAESPTLSYNDLRIQVRLQAAYFGLDVSENNATQFVAWYREEKYIRTYKPEGGRYVVNELHNDRFSPPPL